MAYSLKIQQQFTSKDVGEFYDQLDNIYRHRATLHVHHGLWLRGDETREQARSNLVNWVADELALRPGEHCLDIGSGYGEMARNISRLRNVDVTAVTNSALQHDRALRENTFESVEYHLCDWCSNDLPAATYNAAWAVESLEHVQELDLALRECQRVLKPDGRLIVLSWIAGGQLRAWKQKILNKPLALHNRLARLRSEDEVVDSLFCAGFRQIKTHDLTSRVRRTWWPTVDGIIGQLGWHRGDAHQPGLAWSTSRVALAYAVGAMRYVGISSTLASAENHA